MNITAQVRSLRTRWALFGMSLLGEPFMALRSALFPFVLYKDLGASALQLAIYCAIRPVMSLFSFYWSASLSRSQNKLLSNLMGAWVLARLPFVFLLFMQNVWYVLFAEGVFWLFHRAGTPALMEILKRNLDEQPRVRALSLSFVLQFLESIFIGSLFAWMLGYYPGAWKGLCCGCALIAMLGVFWQRRIPLSSASSKSSQSILWKERLVGPWRQSFDLLRKHPDFARFQIGFTLGGFGLMLSIPALTMFTSDVLCATHANVTVARSICMAVGITLTTFLWQRAVKKENVFWLLHLVLVGFAFYYFVLLMAQFHFHWYYTAFLIYGVAQAGSHLLWHLSGPLFAHKSNSTPFSTVNVLMVGLRGLIAPMLGGLLGALIGPQNVIMISIGLISFGAWYVSRSKIVDTTQQIG